MTVDKETKGAVRFAEAKNPNDPHTKSIYLTKEEVKANNLGKTIKVTIEAVA